MGYFTYLYMAYIGVVTYNPLFLTFDTNLLGHPSSEDEHFKLGGGFKYFLFSPLLGEMIQFD